MALWFRGDRKNFGNQGLCNKYTNQLFGVPKSWRIKWPSHVSARFRNLCRNITINKKVKLPLLNYSRGWEDNITMDFKDSVSGCGSGSYDSEQ